MGITHVIRGEDHLSNTSKHIKLFHALGAEAPHYAHIPLILNQDGSKMSKRDVGASMTTYMEEGFTPEAVLNYLSLLGWSPKDDRQKMAIGEVISLFDLPQILRHNARFDMDKLLSLNGQYLGELDMDSHVAMAKETLEKKGVSLGGHDAQYIRAALEMPTASSSKCPKSWIMRVFISSKGMPSFGILRHAKSIWYHRTIPSFLIFKGLECLGDILG